MPSVQVIDLPYTGNIEYLFEAVRNLPDPIWLDSGVVLANEKSSANRFDIISAVPQIILESVDSSTSICEQSSNHAYDGTPFEAAAHILETMGAVSSPSPAIPFCGGLAGYFAYDIGRHVTANPVSTSGPTDTSTHSSTLSSTLKPTSSSTLSSLPDVAGLPDARLGYYTWALIVDHQDSKARIVFHPTCDAPLRKDISARLRAAAKSDFDNSDFALTSAFMATISKAEYQRQIAIIKDYIYAGDCYQVNFAQHFSANYRGDPWHAYKLLRRALPSPFSAFMSWQNKAVLCLSPERFLALADKQVETRPIKGTAPRGATTNDDQRYAKSLLNSAKDRAENVMIVDLLRNDLGKSCIPGSIDAPELFTLESFANVHHLVSTVTGTLPGDKSAIDLLTDCFPGGSITGAPKKRAMEIIEETEPTRRSVYCGSIGYISACGRMDSNIAIRTLAANAGKLHCWGGGGIVAGSDADAEYAESITKISLLMETLAGA